MLLLYKSGYIVGKYISIEKIVENTKESYYSTLEQSSTNWYEEKMITHIFQKTKEGEKNFLIFYCIKKSDDNFDN